MLTAGPALAAPTEKETELNARQAFAAARYDEAIELFARLYAETLNPIYLRNIGRCHQKKRQPDKAIDAFRDYLAKGKSVSSAERKEIQGYIKEMEQLRQAQAKEAAASPPENPGPAKPTFTPAPPATPPPLAPVGPPPANATNTVDVAPGGNPGWAYGAPPPPPPGGAPNTMLVSNPGAVPPPAQAHPFYTRWWFWTALGVAAAGGVAAALLIPGGVSQPACPTSAMGFCR